MALIYLLHQPFPVVSCACPFSATPVPESDIDSLDRWGGNWKRKGKKKKKKKVNKLREIRGVEDQRRGNYGKLTQMSLA